MREQIIFFVVFLGQILLISLFFARKIAGRMQQVLEKYPPGEYPKLYPDSGQQFKRARSRFTLMNNLVLVAGLVVLAVLVIFRNGTELVEWYEPITTFWFMIQFAPTFFLEVSTCNSLKKMRAMSKGRSRKATLERRSFFDFISPALLGLALLTYGGFVALIIYVNQFDFPWFSPAFNLIGVTGLNLMMATAVAMALYGKKKDPHQDHQDRLKVMQLKASVMVYTAIGATLFVAIAVTLASLDMRSFQPVAQSLFFQAMAVVSFRTLNLDNTNFEVYRADPVTS